MKKIVSIIILIGIINVVYSQENISKEEDFFSTTKIGAHNVVLLPCTSRDTLLDHGDGEYEASRKSINVFLEAFYNNIMWEWDESGFGGKYFCYTTNKGTENYNEFRKRKMIKIYEKILAKYEKYLYCISSGEDDWDGSPFIDTVYDFNKKAYTVSSINFSWMGSYTMLKLSPKEEKNGDLFFKNAWIIKMDEDKAEKAKKGAQWKLIFKIDDVKVVKTKSNKILEKKIYITPVAWRIYGYGDNEKIIYSQHNWNN